MSSSSIFVSEKVAEMNSDSTIEPKLSKMAMVRRTFSETPRKLVGLMNFPIKEYGGPLGALCLILLLPESAYILSCGCHKDTCLVHHMPSSLPRTKLFTDIQAYLMAAGWLVFQAILASLPIGQCCYGHPTQSRTRLMYRCNGIQAAVISMAIFITLAYAGYNVTIIYEKLLEITMSSCILTFFIGLILYIRSGSIATNKLSHQGNTGNIIYDFFIGHELNPAIGSLDLKFFLERRPGYIGWIMINLAFFKKSIEVQQYPSIAMATVALSQIVYALIALWTETSVLSNPSFVTEGVGYQYVFRSIVWLPFTHTLPTRYLIEHHHSVALSFIMPVFALNVFGLLIYKIASRPASHSSRSNAVEKLWASSCRLINMRNQFTASWWGVSRNPQYLADIILSVAWCIPCGNDPLMTYFLPAYMTTLIILRERRERSMMGARYGAKWSDYCRRIQSAIIPRVY